MERGQLPGFIIILQFSNFIPWCLVGSSNEESAYFILFLFFTDNEAVVHAINKQSCKDKRLMYFVRKLVLMCLENNIIFRAKHTAVHCLKILFIVPSSL